MKVYLVVDFEKTERGEPRIVIAGAYKSIERATDEMFKKRDGRIIVQLDIDEPAGIELWPFNDFLLDARGQE